MTSDHETLRDDAAAYVLGTLPDAERIRFAAHLETCADCRREVREIASVFEHMGQSLTPVELPAALRSRVLTQAQGMPARPRALSRHPLPRARMWATWLALAASVIAVVAGGLAWRYRRDASRVHEELSAAQQRVEELTAHVATLEDTATRAGQTWSILAASDLARVELAGQPAAPVARGRVFWSATRGLVFTATNLPPLPPGRVYQLWIVAEAPSSAGTVSPDALGRLDVVSGTPVAARPKAFALTIEPDGGRPAPTGPMFLVGQM